MLTSKECNKILKSVESIHAILQPYRRELTVEVQKLINKTLQLEMEVVKCKQRLERIEKSNKRTEAMFKETSKNRRKA